MLTINQDQGEINGPEHGENARRGTEWERPLNIYIIECEEECELKI